MGQVIEVGSIWIDKSGENPVIVLAHNKQRQSVSFTYLLTINGKLDLTEAFSSIELFLKTKEIMITSSSANKQYVKGKNDGYNEGYQHGFTLAKENGEKDNKRVYNDGYVKGHNDGWRGAVKAYSFGKPDNEVVDKLDKKYEEGYNKGYTQCIEDNSQRNKSEFVEVRQHHYDMGYNDALAYLASEEAEKELELKKQGHNEGYQHGFDLGYSKAIEEIKSSNTGIGHLLGEEWDKGYNEAIKEMSEGESLGETVECIFGTEFFGDSNEEYPREPYPVTKGIDIIKFIKHNFDNIKSFTQVGAVASIEVFDKNNSGVCGYNVPNKETQEVMQEVLDKNSNEFSGIWISKQHNPDWKLEYYSDCGTHVWMMVLGVPSLTAYVVGDLFTISKERLKSDYTKILEYNSVENNTEDEQLKKELALVEKYPHYYKDIRHLNIIDIYRFFDLFEVTDPCLQHSLKKLAVGGKRGAKDYEKDIKEAMDTLKRWEYMQEENKRGLDD